MIDQHDEVGRLAERHDDVVRRIARQHRVRRGTARRWFEEMVRFLDLCHASPEVLAPSRKVDKAWHEFLMFTRAYAAFCEERYGRFLHHDPAEEPDKDAYLRTLAAYTATFGRPPRRIWPAPGGGGCGGSGCGGSCGGGGCGGGS